MFSPRARQISTPNSEGAEGPQGNICRYCFLSFATGLPCSLFRQVLPSIAIVQKVDPVLEQEMLAAGRWGAVWNYSSAISSAVRYKDITLLHSNFWLLHTTCCRMLLFVTRAAQPLPLSTAFQGGLGPERGRRWQPVFASSFSCLFSAMTSQGLLFL